MHNCIMKSKFNIGIRLKGNVVVNPGKLVNLSQKQMFDIINRPSFGLEYIDETGKGHKLTLNFIDEIKKIKAELVNDTSMYNTLIIGDEDDAITKADPVDEDDATAIVEEVILGEGVVENEATEAKEVVEDVTTEETTAPVEEPVVEEVKKNNFVPHSNNFNKGKK